MSKDASLERFAAARNKFPPKALQGYPGNSQLELPEKLAFLIHYSRMTMLLSGPQGAAGSLKQQLAVELQSFHTVLEIDAECLGDEQLVQDLPIKLWSECVLAMQGAGEPSPQTNLNRTQAIARLKAHTTSLAEQFKKVVVIIDGKKSVNAKVIAKLVALTETCGIALVVFSDKDLSSKRNLKPFADQIYSIQLGSMGVGDLKRYLRRNGSGESALSSHQLESLLTASDGDPARIDQLIEGILSEPRRTIGLPLIHLSMIVALLLIVVSAYLVSDSVSQSSHESVSTLTENVRVKDFPAADIVAARKIIEPDPTTLTKADVKPGAVAAFEVSDPEAAPAVGEIVTGPVSLAGKLELQVITPMSIAPVSIGAASIAQSTQPKPIINSLPGQRPTGVSEPYTLQLVGSGSEDAIQALAQTKTSNIELNYFKTRRGGNDWYILTAGSFESREAALLAVSELPLIFEEMKPWPRRIASIQDNGNQ